VKEQDNISANGIYTNLFNLEDQQIKSPSKIPNQQIQRFSPKNQQKNVLSIDQQHSRGAVIQKHSIVAA